MGADYVYMGTSFIATTESMAADEYKQMVIDSKAEDIVCSDGITGVKANWMRNSLKRAGYDPDNMPEAAGIDFAKAVGDQKKWKDIWAAGQGLGVIEKIQAITELVDQLECEYKAAL